MGKKKKSIIKTMQNKFNQREKEPKKEKIKLKTQLNQR